MKITVNIETNDPSDLIRVANALAGVMPDPSTGAAEKPKSNRTTARNDAAAQATTATSAPATTPVNTSSSFDSGPTATTAASPTDPTPPAAIVTEADLTAAANAAAAKLGGQGPAKIKAWIAASFQKADGSPGTLKLTRADQQAALLAGLQEIAQGVKAI